MRQRSLSTSAIEDTSTALPSIPSRPRSLSHARRVSRETFDELPEMPDLINMETSFDGKAIAEEEVQEKEPSAPSPRRKDNHLA